MASLPYVGIFLGMVLSTAGILLPFTIVAAVLIKFSAWVANRFFRKFYFMLPVRRLTLAALQGWAAGVVLFYVLHLLNLVLPGHRGIEILIFAAPIFHLVVNAVFFFLLLRSAVMPKTAGTHARPFSVNTWSGVLALIPVPACLLAWGGYVAL